MFSSANLNLSKTKFAILADVFSPVIFFFLGFVVAAFTNFNLVALGVIGLVCAIVYIQLNPKYQQASAAAAPAAAASSDADDELD